MSHEIAHFLLDFAGKTSVCGATTKEGGPQKSHSPASKSPPRQRHPASAGLRR
jgi:hypothetical protein